MISAQCAQILNAIQALDTQVSPHELDQAYREVCRNFPQTPEAFHHYALWLIQQPQGQDKALAVLEACKRNNPRSGETYYLIARFLEHQLEMAASIQALHHCLALTPDHTKARFHLGLAFLSTGEFDQAMPYFDERLSDQERERLKQGRRWQPELKSSNVLIWAEQGIGDEILFSRFFYCLPIERTCFTIACDHRLVELFAKNFPQLHFVSREQGRALPVGDHAPMGDLLRWYHSHLGSTELKQQCLVSPTDAPLPEQVDTTKTSIGVSWLSMNPESGAQRSIPLSQLCSHLSPHLHRLVSLQYFADEAALEAMRGIGFEVVQARDPFNDISELSDWIKSCDAVITIDNVTAHLAGALGVHTEVLIPKLPNWRWGLNGRDTHWYKNVHLIRQSEAGDWQLALAQLKTY